MMTINDLSLVNSSIEDWEATEDRTKVFRKISAQMYFVRVLMGHVYEALQIIREISDSPILRSAVDRCDDGTISAFVTVAEFANDKKEMEMLRTLRSRASFHYDMQLPAKSLHEIAASYPNKNWSYSMGTESLDWHFELADAVMDRMVVRDVYGLREPRSPERSEKMKAIADRQQKIAIAFTNFAAHFVRHYSK